MPTPARNAARLYTAFPQRARPIQARGQAVTRACTYVHTVICALATVARILSWSRRTLRRVGQPGPVRGSRLVALSLKRWKKSNWRWGAWGQSCRREAELGKEYLGADLWESAGQVAGGGSLSKLGRRGVGELRGRERICEKEPGRSWGRSCEKVRGGAAGVGLAEGCWRSRSLGKRR